VRAVCSWFTQWKFWQKKFDGAQYIYIYCTRRYYIMYIINRRLYTEDIASSSAAAAASQGIRFCFLFSHFFILKIYISTYEVIIYIYNIYICVCTRGNIKIYLRTTYPFGKTADIRLLQANLIWWMTICVYEYIYSAVLNIFSHHDETHNEHVNPWGGGLPPLSVCDV